MAPHSIQWLQTPISYWLALHITKYYIIYIYIYVCVCVWYLYIYMYIYISLYLSIYLSIYIYDICMYIPSYPHGTADAIHWIPQVITHFERKPSSTATAPARRVGATWPRWFWAAAPDIWRGRCSPSWSTWDAIVVAKQPSKKCAEKKKINRSGTFLMDGYELGFQNLRDVLLKSFFGDLRDHFWGETHGFPQQIPQTLHSSPSSKFTSSLLHSQRGLQHLLSSFYLIKRFPMKCCKITSGTTYPTDLV